MSQSINERVAELKIVPVVKLDRAEDAAPLAQALMAGGLPVAEVTFRTEAAVDSIQAMKKIPGMLVGAGTVTNLEQAKQALDIGAEFIVTPGFSAAVTRFAVDHKMPIYPGVCTPTELMMLLEFGLGVAKFFPAGQYGGIKTIQALSGPFPGMKFMPTGGVGPDNIRDYLAVKSVIACGGSWMVKDSLINEQKFDDITALTKEAVSLVR